MKKIVRRVPARTIRSFQCEICGTKFRTKKQALKCEARIKEVRMFKRGDVVKGYRFDICVHRGEEKRFLPMGKVIKVFGPMLPDYEYEVKWLDSRIERLNGHVYLYEVSYPCLCGRQRGYLYRTPEIFLVKS